MARPSLVRATTREQFGPDAWTMRFTAGVRRQRATVEHDHGVQELTNNRVLSVRRRGAHPGVVPIVSSWVTGRLVYSSQMRRSFRRWRRARYGEPGRMSCGRLRPGTEKRPG